MTAANTIPPFANPFARLASDEPRFTAMAIMLALLAIPTLAALGLDARSFEGLNPWIKPLKFELSLGLYLITLAFFARFVPVRMRDRRAYRMFSSAVIFCIAAEIIWIGNGARLAEASHFNNSTPIMAAIYGIMGLFAVTLTSASLVYGIAIFRLSARPLVQATALSLIATFALTLLIAGTMSSGTSHFIGTPVSGDMLPIKGWSREVGDLRAGHFFATHTMHFVPAFALGVVTMTQKYTHRPAILAGLAIYITFTLAVFAQALAGNPFL